MASAVAMPMSRIVAFAACLALSSCFGACPTVGPAAEESEAYQMPNNSMEPTLLAGDFLFARPLQDPPRRDQIIIYETESGPYVKRLVGLPGDTLSMRGGLLWVNGTVVEEPYPIPQDVTSPAFAWQRQFLVASVDSGTYRPTLNYWGPLVVPVAHAFVLGDNRGASADSRYSGFVALEDIVQEPTSIYFSRDPESGSIRWKRIGLQLSEQQ